MWQSSKQYSLQLSTHPYSVDTLTHVSPSFSSCQWTSPALSPSISNLPHATHTSSVPINTENDHIVLPFDPWRSTREPRSLAAVLVCHKSLSGTSVIDGPWWAALTHPASACGGMAWGSIDYDAIRDRGESKMSWRWQGKTKETTVMDEVLLVNVMRFDLRSIDHCRNFIQYDLQAHGWKIV